MSGPSGWNGSGGRGDESRDGGRDWTGDDPADDFAGFDAGAPGSRRRPIIDRSFADPKGWDRDRERADGPPSPPPPSTEATGPTPPPAGPPSTEAAPPPREPERRPQVACEPPGFRIDRVIDGGGMGTVYEAYQPEVERRVAVKRLNPERRESAASRARFARELRALGALSHPNVVQVFCGSAAGDDPFLAMEYVDGVDLSRLIQRTGRLRVADACELIRQAASALQHAYDRGLIHRDVKPSNMMLGVDGRLLVLDWGLARFLNARDSGSDAQLTRAGDVLGTIDYLAPERRYLSDATDVRSDLYSLGCSLHQLLCGRPVFGAGAGDDERAIVLAHAMTTPPALRTIRADAPEALERLLARLLAKEPADRPATPGEVAEALAPLAVGHDLPRLIDSYRSATARDDTLFSRPTGRPATVAEPAPATGRTASRSEVPAPARVRSRARKLAVPTAYLAVGALAVGAVWYNKPGASKAVERIAQVPVAVAPPDRPPAPLEPLALDFGRDRRVYRPGERIRVAVGPGAYRFVAVYRAGFAPDSGLPMEADRIASPVVRPLSGDGGEAIDVGQARGLGVLIFAAAPAPIADADLAAIGGRIRDLAGRGLDAFLDGLDGLEWPPTIRRDVVKYDAPAKAEDGPTGPRRVAMLVGASRFADGGVEDLEFAERDVAAIADDLAGPGGYEILASLTGEGATLAAVEDLLGRLPGETRDGDEVVIYWSGHGGKVPDRDGDETDGDGLDECLLLHDTRLAGTGRPDPATVLVDDRLARALDALEGRKVAVILDVCFAGGAAKGRAARSEGAASIAGFLDRGEAGVKGPGGGGGGPGLAFLAAGTDGQPAFSHGDGRLSVMTYFLDEALRQSGGLTVAAAYDYLKFRVPGYVRGRGGPAQTPVLQGSDEAARTFFLRRD